jgi:hypothetical protein
VVNFLARTEERKYLLCTYGKHNIDSRKLKLTPYKEAPALNVSLNASEAKVVYPPADLPVIQRRCSSTFPLSTLIKEVIKHQSAFLSSTKNQNAN